MSMLWWEQSLFLPDWIWLATCVWSRPSWKCQSYFWMPLNKAFRPRKSTSAQALWHGRSPEKVNLRGSNLRARPQDHFRKPVQTWRNVSATNLNVSNDVYFVALTSHFEPGAKIALRPPNHNRDVLCWRKVKHFWSLDLSCRLGKGASGSWRHGEIGPLVFCPSTQTAIRSGEAWNFHLPWPEMCTHEDSSHDWTWAPVIMMTCMAVGKSCKRGAHGSPKPVFNYEKTILKHPFLETFPYK